MSRSDFPSSPPHAKLALKVPPLVLVAVAAALMWWLPPWGRTPSLDPWGAASTLVGLLGIGICLAGVLAFRRARTTVDPMHPAAASTLVVRGIYHRTRNPMYLGFVLVLLAWAMFLSKLSAWLVLPLFVLYLNRFQIAPEEHALRERFGPAFDAYAAKVRRWL